MHEPFLIVNRSDRALLRVTDGEGKVLTDEHLPTNANGHAIDTVLEWYTRQFGRAAAFRGVGHRIVHGGEKFTEPTLIDERVLAELQALVPLAPLHEPAQIAAVRAVHRQAPGAPQVACFDTSFHAVQPPIARQFALPREYSARGVRRYGFHGLSYEYIVSALPAVAPQILDGRGCADGWNGQVSNWMTRRTSAASRASRASAAAFRHG